MKMVTAATINQSGSAFVAVGIAFCNFSELLQLLNSCSLDLRDGGETLINPNAGDREIRRDSWGISRRRRGSPLAVPRSFRLGRQTPGRHRSAEGKFLVLLSGRHLHRRQHCSHALELVVPAVGAPNVWRSTFNVWRLAFNVWRAVAQSKGVKRGYLLLLANSFGREFHVWNGVDPTRAFRRGPMYGVSKHGLHFRLAVGRKRLVTGTKIKDFAVAPFPAAA